MFVNLATAIILFFLQSLPARLVSCSRQPCVSEDHKSFELTPQFISHLTARLAGDPADQLVIALEDHHIAADCHRQLCSKYLIGSVTIFGQADEKALCVIHRLCKDTGTNYLSDLAGELVRKNNQETLVQFIAKRIRHYLIPDPFRYLVQELIADNWDAMKPLILKVLAAVEDADIRYSAHRLVMDLLPTEERYRMLNDGHVPLNIIGDLYFERAFPLRELFALARCSYSPNVKLRNCIADKFPSFQQFLADDTVQKIVLPCPINIQALGSDVWLHVFTFLDVESLTFVLPLVCMSWCRLYPRVLTHSTQVHDLYLWDFHTLKLSNIQTIAPWKFCLLNEANKFKYFGRCIVDGALARIEWSYELQCILGEYLKAVTGGKVTLPKIQNCTSSYDSFLKLHEIAYDFDVGKDLTLDKPAFITDKEYAQAVYCLVYERKWVLSLSESLIFDDMPSLFGIIKEDKELMKALIIKNFGDFVGASLVLILYSRTNSIPEGLAELVFSQTTLFQKFAGPEPIRSSDYYGFIVEHGILPKLALDKYYMTHLHQLMISLILFFKDDASRIDRLVASMANQLSSLNDFAIKKIKRYTRDIFFKLLKKDSRYSPGDIELIKRITTKFGWLSKSDYEQIGLSLRTSSTTTTHCFNPC